MLLGDFLNQNCIREWGPGPLCDPYSISLFYLGSNLVTEACKTPSNMDILLTFFVCLFACLSQQIEAIKKAYKRRKWYLCLKYSLKTIYQLLSIHEILQASFLIVFEQDLESDVKSDTSGSLRTILVSVLQVWVRLFLLHAKPLNNVFFSVYIIKM